MKECFIIMPISDQPGYKHGHFDEVYNRIIKPVCEELNLNPYRADEGRESDVIMIDVLKRLIESPYAICDISSRNPNVMYELGIRQAFDLPVVLLKDEITAEVFDIQWNRYCKYDSTLWESKNKIAKQYLTEMLKQSLGSSSRNTLVKLLGIKAAESKDTLISNETTLILDAIQNLGQNIRVRTLTDSVSESIGNEIVESSHFYLGAVLERHNFMGLKVDDSIYCTDYGIGVVKRVYKTSQGTVRRIQVSFGDNTDFKNFTFIPDYFRFATPTTQK